MKVDWTVWSLRGLYLFLAVSALSVLWTYFRWPWAGVIKFIPLPFAALAFLAVHFVKRERQTKKQLKEDIRALGNDLTINGDFTIDDFDLLYNVDELKQILSLLLEMPEGRRKLQLAVDMVEGDSV